MLDGDKADYKPSAELFTTNRPAWAAAVEGTAQFDAMPSRRLAE